MAEDFFSAYQNDTTASRIVPLALKAMEIKMEQEKFDMAKKNAIESLRVETEKKKRMNQLFGQTQEEVTLPEVQAPVVPSVLGGNVPQFGLPEMKVNRTVQKQPTPMELLNATADLMKPEEFLKSYTEIQGKPSFHALDPQRILVDNTGKKIAENTNVKPDTAHNVVEIPSPDGKKAQKMQYNPASGKYDIPVGLPYAVKSQVINVNSQQAAAGNNNFETTAQLLSEGKINPSDISKRGGPGMVDKIYKRAREINPDFDPRGQQAENAGYQATISMQEKQIGQMGSFVKNMSKQIDRVEDIGKELASFDARILNLPLRAARSKITGSANQAKYDMYITEIESEIGKLATGSAASIAELSISAQEKWSKIHDKNLSIKDMISLLKETKHAGEMRMDSVSEQLKETVTRRKNKFSKDETKAKKTITLKSGKIIEVED